MPQILNLLPGSTLAYTASGALAGLRTGEVNAFLGIPYAAPPVGARRWQSPQPVTPWVGVRDASRFGPSAWQAVTPQGFGPWTHEYMVPGEVSEDALYLNVWAPTEVPTGGAPVLVWVHGGGFAQGSGSVPVYAGHSLARRGVVVVTLNYRLGALGFFPHPDLAVETGQPGGGNFGLEDQVAALRWVQDNIAAFGGDPTQVTLAGQSAGAMSVHLLMSAPSAQGLFHSAIAQSGPPSLVRLKNLDQAQADALALAAELGADSIDALRTLSAGELTGRITPGFRFMPFVGSAFVPVWPPQHSDCAVAGGIPMLVGHTTDENSGLDPQYGSADPGAFAELMTHYFGEAMAAEQAARYLRKSAGNVAHAHRQAARERWSGALWHWAEHRCRTQSAPLFAYLFEHVEPGPEAARYGAFHSSDVPYVLGTLDAATERMFTAVDRQVSDLAGRYWVNFVKTGNPNGPDLPSWPAWQPDTARVLPLGAVPVARPMFTETAGQACQQLIQTQTGAVLTLFG